MADLCPRCGAPDVEGDKCARCGVIASVYKASLEKMRRPPTLPAAAPTVDYGAAPPPSSPAATATAAWPLGGPSRGRKLTFHGSAGTLFGIHTVNILLTLVTLGFYRFWGKVKIRRYILSQTAFEGDRFGYHGTGKELLLGFVKALLFVGLPIAALSWAGQLTEDTLIQVGARLLTSSLVMVFIPIATVGARRYRLSRTSWRGIRFSFRGRAGLCEALRGGLDPERIDVEPLLSVLRDESPRLPGLALLLRAAAPPLRRSRARPVRPLPPGPAAPVADAGVLLVLVPGEEGPLLLGAHRLRDRALSLHGHRPPAHEPDALERAAAPCHARLRLALGARAQHAVRVRVRHDRRSAGPRRDRPGAPGRVRHRRRALELLRRRRRPRVAPDRDAGRVRRTLHGRPQCGAPARDDPADGDGARHRTRERCDALVAVRRGSSDAGLLRRAADPPRARCPAPGGSSRRRCRVPRGAP